MATKLKTTLLVVVFICLTKFLLAQTSENESYQQLHMLNVKQDNDLYQYWFKSDKDFTDGFHIELYHRVFNNKIANWLLIGFENEKFNDFSLSVGQDIFTPENIATSLLDTNDRPYSALLYFNYSKYSNQFFKGKKISSKLMFGLSGRKALGNEIQNGVHKKLGNQSANGWAHQLGTGLMLDYNFKYEQLLPFSSSFFETSFYGKAHLGTIYNYGALGIEFKIGHYSDSYLNNYGIANHRNKNLINRANFEKLTSTKLKLIPKNIRKKDISTQVDYLKNRLNRKFQFYIIIDFQYAYQLYDGTAQGSLIQFENSEYTLDKPGNENSIVKGHYGINIQYSRFQLFINRYLENNVFEKDGVFGYGEINLSYIF